MPNPPASPPFERRAVFSLAGLYIFRMLGLFMVLPVLSLYGQGYQGASPALLGLALGIYGLSQACLQLPFGYLSDRFGRKPLIAIGLLLFAAGSLLAASADSVYGLIAGRFLQGCGAIAAVVMATVADLTAEENRTKAMALIGVSIGASFTIALILGPLISQAFGLAGIFWATAGLALAGLWVLWRLVPTVPKPARQPLNWRSVFRDAELWRLNVGIFALHFVLMATFIVMPRYLEQQGFGRDGHWLIYLPVMLLSFLAMVPFMLWGERSGRAKWVYLGAIALLVLVQSALLVLPAAAWLALAGLFLFFMAFNLLEATLPSWVSKVALPELKGTATGVYSTWQFAGAFAGGAAGGLVLQWYGLAAVFLLCALVLVLWWAVACFQVPPGKPLQLRVQLPAGESWQGLASLPGVRRATWVAEDATVLLQVDSRHFDQASLAPYRWQPA